MTRQASRPVRVSHSQCTSRIDRVPRSNHEPGELTLTTASVSPPRPANRSTTEPPIDQPRIHDARISSRAQPRHRGADVVHLEITRGCQPAGLAVPAEVESERAIPSATNCS